MNRTYFSNSINMTRSCKRKLSLKLNYAPNVFIILYVIAIGSCLSNLKMALAVKYGEHSAPSKGVTVLPGTFPNPIVFYKHFVSKGEPLLMKNVLPDSGFKSFKTWTDGYLRDTYGSEFVHVEKGKKEDRSRDISSIRFSKFLEVYLDIDLYMVFPVPDSMLDEVEVPFTLQCGGFQTNLHDSIIWFSGGDTKSVLHYDAADNILCALDGMKQVILIDKKYDEQVRSAGFVEKEGYSKMDVDNVDPDQFAHILSLPWVQANITKGDCLYIPYKWFHHVYSPAGRNLAINTWFSHLWWLNETDCQGVERGTPFKTLSQFEFASPNEQLRTEFLEAFESMESVSYDDFVKTVRCQDMEDKERMWKFINTDGDESLTWPEMYKVSMDELVMIAPQCFLTAADMEETLVVEDEEEESEMRGVVTEGAAKVGGVIENVSEEIVFTDDATKGDQFQGENIEDKKEDLDLTYVKLDTEREKELEEELNSIFNKEVKESISLENQILKGDFDNMDLDLQTSDHVTEIDREEIRTNVPDNKDDKYKVKEDVHDEF